MKLTFKEKEVENNFKDFACENKSILLILCDFGQLAKNPIVRIVFRSLAQIINVVCTEKKTK